MITKKLFDNYNGRDIYAYTITDGIEVTVCELGATILSLKVPNDSGRMIDVALGMTNAADMLSNGCYMGAVVGRCANRIAEGRFTLNGVEYNLATNNGKAHLHGGDVGFNAKVYEVSAHGNELTMTTTSADGEEGYPGNLTLTVRYTVFDNTLKIEYIAKSDKDTVFNPTNHVYFNLNGESDGNICDNYLEIFADNYLQLDGDLIPTVAASVDGTPFDFRKMKAIGADIDADHPQLKIGGGYDHNYCLNSFKVARAYSPKTHILMNAFTSMPGVQLYTGNFTDTVGKSRYGKRSGFCLETQYYPDAINRDDCDKPILKAGQEFYSWTAYGFHCIKLDI